MSKYSVIWRRLAALGSVLFLCLGLPVLQAQTNSRHSRPPAPRRPNILLILADNLGCGDLGCYGQTKIQTPNIDKLASEGMRFTGFYAGAPAGAPSRCALMSGLDTGHTPVRAKTSATLPSSCMTVALMLKQGGYATGFIGKWGLGAPGTSGSPQRQGFEEVVGYVDPAQAEDYYPYSLSRYGPRVTAHQVILAGNAGGRQGDYAPKLFTIAALNFLRIHKPDQFNRHQSFFLCLAYPIPHANPMVARSGGNGTQVPGDGQYSDRDWSPAQKDRAAMITRLDGYVGQIMAQLKRLQLDENTLVVFTSARGPATDIGADIKLSQSAGPLPGANTDLYEGGIRVPFLARWAGTIAPGQVNDQPAALWDFLPTADDIARLKPPKGIDGLSLLPVLLSQARAVHHKFLYWESFAHGFQQAVRMGDWKALRLKPGQPLELFNLKKDPAERHNVAKQNPGVVKRIETYLKTARTEPGRWTVKPGEAVEGADKPGGT